MPDSTAVVDEVYGLLKDNNSSKAVERLWAHNVEHPLADDPPAYLAYARALGELGVYSECLRITDDLRHNPNVAPEWRLRGGIWSAVYWSRIEEWERAAGLLAACAPPEDDGEFAVLHWSHRLTLAIETGDFPSAKAILCAPPSELEDSPAGSSDALELKLWRTVLEPFCETLLSKDVMTEVASDACTICKELDKAAVITYMEHRLAKGWELAGELPLAQERFLAAREAAFPAGNGIAYLRATLDLLQLPQDSSGPSKSQRKKWIEEAIVVAGQTGISLVPSRLTGRLWKLVDEAAKNARPHYIAWLLEQRTRPPLTSLTDDSFEAFCARVLVKHSESIFGIPSDAVDVTFAPDGEEHIDLWIRHKHHPHTLKAGVQCKGGTTVWTSSRMNRKYGDCWALMNTVNNRLNKPEVGGQFVMMVSTRLDQGAVKLLRDASMNVLKREPIVLQGNDLETMLSCDPELRFALTHLFVQDLKGR